MAKHIFKSKVFCHFTQAQAIDNLIFLSYSQRILPFLGNRKPVARGKKSKSFQCGDYVSLAWLFSKTEKKTCIYIFIFTFLNENVTLSIHKLNMATQY